MGSFGSFCWVRRLRSLTFVVAAVTGGFTGLRSVPPPFALHLPFTRSAVLVCCRCVRSRSVRCLCIGCGFGYVRSFCARSAVAGCVYRLRLVTGSARLRCGSAFLPLRLFRLFRLGYVRCRVCVSHAFCAFIRSALGSYRRCYGCRLL